MLPPPPAGCLVSGSLVVTVVALDLCGSAVFFGSVGNVAGCGVGVEGVGSCEAGTEGVGGCGTGVEVEGVCGTGAAGR